MNQNNDNAFVTTVNDLSKTATQLWWQFFDYLAVTSWNKVAILMLFFLFFGIIFNIESMASFVIITSLIAKSLAGKKRTAEIVADSATQRADVEALERRLVEARMQALQAQIEPHFLFNTLALIGQLIETNPQKANIVHQHLVDYLRSAMPQMREQSTGRLGQQLELSRAYLLIMQARMNDRLSFEILTPEHLKHVFFPSMMLQTLVENSIKHGLEPKISGGSIQIEVSEEQDKLLVSVIDSGIGFNFNADEGVGLSNIRERLKILYGKQAQLIIEAPAQGGCIVRIQIPKQI